MPAHMNGGRMNFVGAPFGGIKNSGLGRVESFDELLSYMQCKSAHVTL